MWLVVACWMVATSAMLNALPRYSLLTGTRCSGCHFNPQGGGIRTELGWSFMSETGAVEPEQMGLGSMFDIETNSYFDGMVTLGLDARLQVAAKRPTAKEHDRINRIIIPMQLSPYLAIEPLEYLKAYGSINVNGFVYRSYRGDSATFPGQADWEAAILIQPGVTAPSLKVGMIQPSIGIRHDDHTMFVRREAGVNLTPLIPPNYNELGGQITYEGTRWLTVDLGVYAAHQLHEVDPTVNANNPSFLARAMIWPQLLDEGINTEFGGSYFVNGSFRMVNAFAGIGLADQATLYAEGMISQNSDDIKTRNLMILGSYQAWDWLAVELRYEHGITQRPGTSDAATDSYVAGLQFFPIPYLELRPEYRLTDHPEFRLGYYAVQLHIFY